MHKVWAENVAPAMPQLEKALKMLRKQYWKSAKHLCK
jgi:hypothetical protein